MINRFGAPQRKKSLGYYKDTYLKKDAFLLADVLRPFKIRAPG